VKSPSLLEFEWQLPPGVRAAFTTRLGGVSEAPWDSFNVATHVGDEPAHVAANRARLRELCGWSAEPVWLNQIHGVEVTDLDVIAPTSTPIAADASVTTRTGVACVVMVADCLPVLFASKDGSRIGAAHAGWRGLAGGVLEATVGALRVPGKELLAWIGPGISREHFEVGEEVRAEFVKLDSRAAACFERNARGRWQADLAGLAVQRLNGLGLSQITQGDWCTYADRKQFYSHRRDGKTGRLAGAIWREETQLPRNTEIR
jgi:polyphenol oxidase